MDVAILNIKFWITFNLPHKEYLKYDGMKETAPLDL